MKKLKTPSLIVLSSTLALCATMYSTNNQHASASTINTGIIKLKSVKKIADTGSVTYSPNNSAYLLQQDTNLFVVQNGTKTKIASNVAKATWKKDGQGIVFSVNPSTTGLHSDVTVYETDVTGKKTTQIGMTDKPLRFSLDNEGNAFLPKKNGLQKIDLAKNTTNVLSKLDVDDYRVSPDGQWVATLKGTDLSLVNLNNGITSLLTDSVDWHQLSDFAWNDSSEKFAYTAHTSPHDEALFIYDINSKKSKSIYSVNNYLLSGVNWLKNDYLIYQLLPLRTSNTQENAVYETLSAAGNSQPNMLFKNGLGVRITQDGKKITFIRDSDPTGVTNGAFVADLEY